MIQRIRNLFSQFGEYWSGRRTLGEQRQQEMLLDFMPAVLEIEKRPPSPIGRLVAWLIIALFTVSASEKLLDRKSNSGQTFEPSAITINKYAPLKRLSWNTETSTVTGEHADENALKSC